jgi:predicted ATPase
MSRIKRVFLTGTHRSGKTTFAERICETYPDKFRFVKTDVAGAIRKAGLTANRNLTDETVHIDHKIEAQCAVAQHIIGLVEAEDKDDHRIVIYDRGIADVIAYSKLITMKHYKTSGIICRDLLIMMHGICHGYDELMANDSAMIYLSPLPYTVEESEKEDKGSMSDQSTIDEYIRGENSLLFGTSLSLHFQYGMICIHDTEMSARLDAFRHHMQLIGAVD